MLLQLPLTIDSTIEALVASHKPGTEWPTPVKARVCSAHFDLGLSARQCQKQFGISYSTCQRLLGAQTDRRQTRSGPTRQFDDAEVRAVLDDIVAGKFKKRSLTWDKMRIEYNLTYTDKTLRAGFDRFRYHKCKACPKPFIGPQSRVQRLDFADTYASQPLEFWQDWVFSDECTFTTGKQSKCYVLRQQGERYCDHCIQNRYHSGRTSFAIWAAIGWNYEKSPLVFLEGSFIYYLVLY